MAQAHALAPANERSLQGITLPVQYVCGQRSVNRHCKICLPEIASGHSCLGELVSYDLQDDSTKAPFRQCLTLLVLRARGRDEPRDQNREIHLASYCFKNGKVLHHGMDRRDIAIV